MLLEFSVQQGMEMGALVPALGLLRQKDHVSSGTETSLGNSETLTQRKKEKSVFLKEWVCMSPSRPWGRHPGPLGLEQYELSASSLWSWVYESLRAIKLYLIRSKPNLAQKRVSPTTHLQIAYDLQGGGLLHIRVTWSFVSFKHHSLGWINHTGNPEMAQVIAKGLQVILRYLPARVGVLSFQGVGEGGGRKTGKDWGQEFKFSLSNGDGRQSCCFLQ
jgi:hypothetical protein